MAIFAVGDIQGCYNELRGALDQIRFDPGKDTLWSVGDLVNRGPGSLEVLRYIRDLGESAVCVLGNHDLHLLALAAGNQRREDNSSLTAVLEAPDRDELLHWLRHRPMLHHDPQLNFVMVHAGLPPQWDVETALACANEVEAVLRGGGHQDFFRHMYGNKPSRWDPGLSGMERWRFTTNCLTRLRYCDKKGRLALKEKGRPGSQKEGHMPWFEHPGRRSRDQRIVCGHWSTLGYVATHNIWALDTGCVWGGSLTLLQIDKDPPRPFSLTCPRWQDPDQFV